MWNSLLRFGRKLTLGSPPASWVAALVRRRPWLTATAALAMTLLGLFGWFIAARWDDVGVTSAPPAMLNLEFADVDPGAAAGPLDASPDPFDNGSPADAGVVPAETLPSDSGSDGAFDGVPTTFAARGSDSEGPALTGGAASPRAAWLTGTIEDVEPSSSEQNALRTDHAVSRN